VSKRHKARAAALNILFEGRLRGLNPIELLAERGVGEIMEADYAKILVSGVAENQAVIDGAIEGYAEGWDLDRMPVADLIIAQIATYEILYQSNLDDAVAISEAMLLANEFSTENSGKFLNGVLGRISAVKEALL
jgi:N utilization substance protein B